MAIRTLTGILVAGFAPIICGIFLRMTVKEYVAFFWRHFNMSTDVPPRITDLVFDWAGPVSACLVLLGIAILVGGILAQRRHADDASRFVLIALQVSTIAVVAAGAVVAVALLLPLNALP